MNTHHLYLYFLSIAHYSLTIDYVTQYDQHLDVQHGSNYPNPLMMSRLMMSRLMMSRHLL